jgi:hypothetical protein
MVEGQWPWHIREWTFGPRLSPERGPTQAVLLQSTRIHIPGRGKGAQAVSGAIY